MVADELHRRKGIGAALMGELERLAMEWGCGYVIPVTESDRRDARRFYSSLGFGADTHKDFKKRLAP